MIKEGDFRMLALFSVVELWCSDPAVLHASPRSITLPILSASQGLLPGPSACPASDCPSQWLSPHTPGWSSWFHWSMHQNICFLCVSVFYPPACKFQEGRDWQDRSVHSSLLNRRKLNQVLLGLCKGKSSQLNDQKFNLHHEIWPLSQFPDLSQFIDPEPLEWRGDPSTLLEAYAVHLSPSLPPKDL